MLDTPHKLIFLPTLIHFVLSTGIAFQGSCEDRSVLCEQLCIALSSDTYKCWCWDGHMLLGDGIGCVANESRISIQFSAHATDHLTKFPLRPIHFTGHNFVQFPAPENAYLETSIVIEFRTEDYNEGILLYAGEYEGNDFISIIFKHGDIVFRFNCGEGTLEETYAGPFQKNIWHRLTAKRVFCDRSQIIVDSENALSDEIQLLNNYKGVTIETGICIGGAPERVRNLHHQTSTVKRFRGCVRYVVVNNVTLYDINSRINHVATPIQLCGEELVTVVKSEASIKKFSTISTISSTKSALSTVALSESKEYAVGFDETSYVKVRAPKDYGTYLELTFLIKLQQPNGLIYLLLSIHHHFAIYLEDAFLMVHYEIADDYEILRSQHPLLLNKWHRIEVWRTGKSVLLKTDHQQWVESHINGTGQFDDDGNSISYFGRAPTLEIPLSLGKLNGFSGCLKKVYQNGQFVDLIPGVLNMKNVHRCGWDACATTHCEGQAQCTVYRAEPYCRCQFPSFGTLCEKNYNSSIAHLRFDRFSYLKLSDQNIMKHVAGENLNVSFMILLRNKTNDRSLASGDQILACTSENELVGDYFNLFLSSDNEVKLLVNLGSGPAALTHPTILEPDGLWHNITVLRNGRHISLSVDELSISSVTPGTSVELNVYDAFYIGGLSKIKPSLMGFIGCISHIRIGMEEIESPVKATEAVNIADCFEERK